MIPITWPYIHVTINHFPIVLSTMGLSPLSSP